MFKKNLIVLIVASTLSYAWPVNSYFFAQVGNGELSDGIDNLFQPGSYWLAKKDSLNARGGIGINLLSILSIETGVNLYPSGYRCYQNNNNEIFKSKIYNNYGADVMLFFKLINLEFGAGYALTKFSFDSMNAKDENNIIIHSWAKNKKNYLSPKIEARLSFAIDNDLSVFVSAAHVFGIHDSSFMSKSYQAGISTISLGVKF